MSELVILSNDVEPKFPTRCVICNAHNDGEFAEMKGEPNGTLGYVQWLFGKTGKLKVAAHEDCARSQKRKNVITHFGILFVSTSAIIACFMLLIYRVPLPFEMTKIKAVIIAVIAVAPIMLWREFNEPAFEFRVGDNIITYEFSDEDYAKEFAELNETEIGANAEWLGEVGGSVAKIAKRI